MSDNFFLLKHRLYYLITRNIPPHGVRKISPTGDLLEGTSGILTLDAGDFAIADNRCEITAVCHAHRLRRWLCNTRVGYGLKN
jgi:hypothetical protein